MAVLLTFNLSAVTGKEASFADGRKGGGVGLDQRAGDAEHAGTGLSGESAAGDVDPDVEAGAAIGGFEGGPYVVTIPEVREVIVEFAAVDTDFATAGPQSDACHGGFAPAGAPAVFFGAEVGSGGLAGFHGRLDGLGDGLGRLGVDKRRSLCLLFYHAIFPVQKT